MSKLRILGFAFLLLSLLVANPSTSGAAFANDQLHQLKSCLIKAGVSTDHIFDNSTTPEQYNQLNAVQWNIRGGKIYPLAYLLPESVTDIQKAVICGKRYQVRVVPKSGGHGFAKYAFGDSKSLIVDLRKMDDVDVVVISDDIDQQQVSSKSAMATGSTSIVVVGPGTRFGKLGYTIWEQGNFTTAIGVCPAVGVGGFTLGGGYGVFVREFGLLSDNLLEVEMIDADGRLVIANHIVNPDLFWGLRGAGAGTFGIITKFKFRLYEAPPKVSTYMLEYDFETQFHTLFSAWQQYVTSNLTTFGLCMFGTQGNSSTRPLIGVQFAEMLYPEKSAARRTQEMDQILTMFPTPIQISVEVEPYPIWLMNRAMNTYSTGSLIRPNINVTQPSDLVLINDGIGEEYYIRKSFFVDKILDNTAIQELFLLYQSMLPQLPSWFDAFGGAALNPSEGSSASAWSHRGALYIVNLRYEGEQEDPDWTIRANNFFEGSKSLFQHKASYQNYVDEDMPDYLERYYGHNLERLVEVKSKWDPENFFSSPQSIPVDNTVPGPGNGVKRGQNPLGLFTILFIPLQLLLVGYIYIVMLQFIG